MVGVASNSEIGWAVTPADRTEIDVAIGTITDSRNAAFNSRADSSCIAVPLSRPVSRLHGGIPGGRDGVENRVASCQFVQQPA